MRNTLSIIAGSLLFLFSCAVDTEKNTVDPVNEMEQLNELVESLEEEPPGWQEYFDLKVPSHMIEMTELNPEAIAQFGYVEEVVGENGEGKVLEHYLIIMMEKKSDIKGYPAEVQVDVQSYRDDAVRALRNSDRIESFTVLNKPVTEAVNGIPCIKNEMEVTLMGNKGPVELYYQLGIYESDLAFYQVLTWCIGNQQEEFRKDMERMLNSFRERGQEQD